MDRHPLVEKGREGREGHYSRVTSEKHREEILNRHPVEKKEGREGCYSRVASEKHREEILNRHPVEKKEGREGCYSRVASRKAERRTIFQIPSGGRQKILNRVEKGREEQYRWASSGGQRRTTILQTGIQWKKAERTVNRAEKTFSQESKAVFDGHR
jgi:hypothetical protein